MTLSWQINMRTAVMKAVFITRKSHCTIFMSLLILIFLLRNVMSVKFVTESSQHGMLWSHIPQMFIVTRNCISVTSVREHSYTSVHSSYIHVTIAQRKCMNVKSVTRSTNFLVLWRFMPIATIARGEHMSVSCVTGSSHEDIISRSTLLYTQDRSLTHATTVVCASQHKAI